MTKFTSSSLINHFTKKKKKKVQAKGGGVRPLRPPLDPPLDVELLFLTHLT